MNLDYLTETIKIKPYQHQLDAVEFFHDKKDGFLFFDMGTGKTGTAILTHRNWCKKEGRMLRCLVVAPSVVLHNWKDEFKMFSNVDESLIFPLTRGSGKEKAEKVFSEVMPILDGTVITVNYEALLNADLFLAIERWKPEVIIFDECFTGDTKVKTPHGYKKIKDIQKGDEVCNATGTGVVIETSVRQLKEYLELEFGGEKIKCSLEHPFLTHNGWVKAIDLKIGDKLVTHYKTMQTMRKRFHHKNVPEHDPFVHFLFRILSDEISDIDGAVSEVYNSKKSNEGGKEYRKTKGYIQEEIRETNFIRLDNITHKKFGNIKREGENLFYNLEVSGHPSYVVNEAVVHNCHYLKNSTAKRSKLCIRLAEHALYRLGLTGTPILRNSMDMYGIFRAVDLGKTFGTNKFVFQSKYLVDKNARNPHVNFPNWADNPVTFKELNEKIYKKSLRKLKSECLDLPDLIKVVRLAEWGTKQLKAYKELKKEFLTYVDAKKKAGEPQSVTASIAVVKAMRMLQVASGFVQTDDGEIHEFEEVPKLKLLEELLEEIVVENGEKCIVWCNFKHNYKMIARVCERLNIKHCFITGEQDTNEKRASEQAFQKDKETMICIANPSAGGVGVNLTAASHSIVYSRGFSLAHALQSEARNHRGGSEIHDKIVKIDLAVKDSLDLEVMVALNNKHQISTDILDIIKE